MMANKEQSPVTSIEDLAQPLIIPPDAYISREYLDRERTDLWRKTWLQAGRVDDIPEAGNYISYEIMDDSVLILRGEDGSVRAFHNVCPHRGRRLVDVAEGARNAKGKRMNFVCGYHAWTFNLEGENTYIEHKDDWQGSLEGDCSNLTKVHVETWGGWIWINLNPDAEPLAEYLAPIPEMLEPFHLENMKARWRKWIIFDCNWKVAMEAFAETYHVPGTHPEFMAFGQFRGWGRNQGLHAHIGYEAPKGQEEDAGKLRLGTGDARVSTAEMQEFTWKNANTNTTETLVAVSKRLVDELPEDTPAPEVSAYWLKTAREEDAARGVVWPTVEPQHTAKTGTAWQVFPNFQIGHAVNNMLCYQARPYGDDPNKCIFEAAVYQLYPEGEAPQTEWEYTKRADWPPVLQQDFDNMEQVQRGMKNVGFRGIQLNPYMERSIASLHYNLAKYVSMGTPLKKG